jgi:signal transduction histidine kinase
LPICRSIIEAHGGRIRVHNGLALGGPASALNCPQGSGNADDTVSIEIGSVVQTAASSF